MLSLGVCGVNSQKVVERLLRVSPRSAAWIAYSYAVECNMLIADLLAISNTGPARSELSLAMNRAIALKTPAKTEKRRNRLIPTTILLESDAENYREFKCNLKLR